MRIKALEKKRHRKESKVKRNEKGWKEL